MLAASCGSSVATRHASQPTIGVGDAVLPIPTGWKEIDFPADQQAALRAIDGTDSRMRMFSRSSDPPIRRAFTADDLPVLAVGRFPSSDDTQSFSSQPEKYRRQMEKLQRDMTRMSGRRQAPVHETTLGGAPAVANDIDRITVPLANEVEARQLNISAVRKGHRYILSLFVALRADAGMARTMLDHFRSSWRWK